MKCPICKKCVSDSHSSICCDLCNLWVHQANCSTLSLSQFETLCLPNSSPWFCPKCVNALLPFHQDTLSDPINFEKTSGSGIADDFKSLISDLNKVIDDSVITDEDDPESKLNSTTCKYLEYQDFNTLSQNTRCKFSAFHLNIASMSRHFDEFSTLLSLLQHKFSFIGISETRFLNHQEPLFDFSIPGYSHISTPTESSAGGVLLYISNSFAFKTRPDLSKLVYQSKNLESVFAEIIVPK